MRSTGKVSVWSNQSKHQMTRPLENPQHTSHLITEISSTLHTPKAIDKTIMKFTAANDTHTQSRHRLNVTVAILLYKQSPCFTSGPSLQNQHDQTAERGHMDTF